MTQYIVLW